MSRGSRRLGGRLRPHLGVRREGGGEEARPLAQRLLAIFEKGLGPEHPDVAGSLNNLAGLYRARHDVVRAVTLQARAADVEERNLRLVLDTGAEDQQRAYLSTLTGETNATISLHAEFGRNDLAALRLALTTVLRRKGRVLDAMAESLATLRRRLRPEDASLFEQWASARAELAALTLKGSRESAGRVTRERITALAARAEQLEAQLSARSTALRVHAQGRTAPRRAEGDAEDRLALSVTGALEVPASRARARSRPPGRAASCAPRSLR